MNTLRPDDVEVSIDRVEAAEVDELWSSVGTKQEQRWLWHALDHGTGKVLAYVCGRRRDEVFLQLKALLEPFGITRFFTDHWGVYARQLAPETHVPGKRHTQQIERKPLPLRTRIKRLARKTIGFSKSPELHDIVIGLVVNRYEFGLSVCTHEGQIYNTIAERKEGIMQYRTLGRTGLQVSDVGFGAMTIGGEIFGATDDQESLRALHRAVDRGMNFIDTADAYGRGHSEELLGQLLKTRRKEVVLATKGGNHFTVRQGLRNFDPDYITSALEASLNRLQIETIDLYQLHNPSPEVMRRGDIFERLDRCKREGKIRFYGVSLEKTADGIVAIETGKPDALQVVYNIFHQDPEEQLFPLAQQENIGILARVPLERGVLAGRFQNRDEFGETDWRRGVFPEDGLAQTRAAVEKLDFLIKGDVPNLAQAALRFILSHPAVSTVIPGIRTVRQVEDNLAVSGKSLAREDLERLRALYRSEFCQLPFH